MQVGVFGGLRYFSMKWILSTVLILLLLTVCATAPLPVLANGSQSHFSSEHAAQEHCPQDSVVWVNTNSGVYHFRGQRWYGNTKEGTFECRGDADQEGDRATKNGQ